MRRRIARGRLLRVHDGAAAREPGRQRRRQRCVPARGAARSTVCRNSCGARRALRADESSCRRDSGRRARGQGQSRPTPRPTGFSAASTRACRRCRRRATPIGAPTRSARSRISKRPTQLASRRADDARTAVPRRRSARQGRRDCWRRSSSEQPEQVEAVALLAEAYQATDRDADAIALLEKSVEDAPELYGALGQAYQDSGRWQRCGTGVPGRGRRAAAKPSAARAVGHRAARTLGDAQRAREVLEAGIGGQLTQSRALYLLSEAQRRTRDYAAAEVTARRLIALDPRALGGPRQLAQIFSTRASIRKSSRCSSLSSPRAFAAADAADLTSDTFRGMYFDLAHRPTRALRQFDKAIAMLTQARALSPTDPLVDIRLARSQQDGGKGDDADQHAAGGGREFPEGAGVKLSLASTLERAAEVQRGGSGLPADDRGRPEERRRAQLARLHVRRTRAEAWTKRCRWSSARCDRSRQRRVSRQPRMGVLQAEPARSRGGAAAGCRETAADRAP